MNPRIKILIQVILLLLVFVGAFYLASIAEEIESVRLLVSQYHYWGVFVVALVSGFNILVPVPAISFMPLYLVSGLEFFPSILVITLGMVTADSLAYFIGRLGRRAVKEISKEENKILKKLESWQQKYRYSPLIIVFLFASFVPLPNELILIPLGILGYRFLSILPLFAGGTLIFNILYSTGVLHIFQLI